MNHFDDSHPVDARIAAAAERQHGIVDRRDLLRLGLTEHQIRRRRRQGNLHPLYRDVFAVGDRLIPAEGRWLAAVRGAGPGALLSHRTAAALWGLLREGRGYDVTVPPGSGRRSRGGLRVHRAAVRHEERALRAGIPLTSVARTVLDLAATARPDTLRKALREAEHVRLFDLVAMQAVLRDHPGERGTGRLARALLAFTSAEGTRSDFEARFLELCTRRGIPRPAVNTLVGGHLVDFLWPEQRVVVETDGWGAHGTRTAFERDHQRDLELELRGYVVIRITWRQLRYRPDLVVRRVRQALSVVQPVV